MNGLLFRFAGWCPGAFGLWLRQKLFPKMFYSCGRGVLFGRFVRFIAPEKICLGNRVVLADGVIVDAGAASAGPAVILEDNVFIGIATTLCAEQHGVLTIRENANFSSLCRVTAEGVLEVGKNCLVAAYCELGTLLQNSSQADESEGRNRAGREGACRRITVADGGWLGVRTHILPGVRVGHDTIVGAHAVVSRNLPACVVAVGRPATVLRNR